MAKDINLLEQVFERSWNYYDEQLSKILNEAVTIFKWMEEVIPATEEALDRCLRVVNFHFVDLFRVHTVRESVLFLGQGKNCC